MRLVPGNEPGLASMTPGPPLQVREHQFDDDDGVKWLARTPCDPISFSVLGSDIQDVADLWGGHDSLLRSKSRS